jgi:hypothetical protein
MGGVEKKTELPFLNINNFLNEKLIIITYNIRCHIYYKANIELVVKCVR